MRDSEWEKDTFDELLHQALASDAVPSDDFTARLMEQVRRTPQERVKNRPYRKILAALAACAVIAAAIPLVIPRMGSAADSSAANGSEAFQYAATDSSGEELMVGSSLNQWNGAAPSEGDDSSADNNMDSSTDSSADKKQYEQSMDNGAAITLTGTDAANARAALDDMSISPTSQEEDGSVYTLTAEQAAALGEQIDALYGIESQCTLILEDSK